MKNSKIHYSKGATFSGASFWLGLFLIVLSIGLFLQAINLLQKTALVLLLYAGLCFFLRIEGTTIDYKHKTVTEYFNIFIVKIPIKKFDVSNFTSIELVLFSQNQTLSVGYLPPTTSINTKVYELKLCDNQGLRIMVAESTDYEKTKKLMTEIAEGLQISAHNKYKEWRQSVIAKRRR